MRILIAEDDFTSRIALAGVLKKSGHEVVETVNGAAAWEVLQQPDAPRLVILDWMMPEMDGMEVLRRVRAQPTDRPAYIILLTAKDAKANIIAGLEAGANDYLIKPFNVGELRARIEVGHRMVEMQDTLTAKIAELHKSEEKHRILLEKSSDPIFSFTPEFQCGYVNRAFARRMGQPVEKIIGKSIWDIFPEEEANTCFLSLDQVFRTGEEEVIEVSLQSAEGERYYLTTITPIKDATGQVISALCSAKDITERRQVEACREMSREILKILNDPGGLSDALHQVLEVLKTRTGFDAVGIRLQDGEDFPYFAQKGFPPDFYLTENTLMGRTVDGGLCRDENGHPMLECTCGLVISGKIDPASPLFTPGGSFWINDSLPLLDLSPIEDPRFQPRNQCIHHHYASFALVPIRNEERIVGLIHFSDRRKGCFTLDTIELLEGIASHIGAALMRKRAEETLRAEQKRLADIIGFLPDATLAVDTRGRVIIWNQAMEKMTGLPAAEMIGKGDYAYAIPFYGEARPQLIDLIFKDNDAIAALYPHITREGGTLVAKVFCKALYGHEGGWVFAKASPLRDQSGKITGAIESIRDITASKHTEEKLKKSIAWFKALFNATSDSVILIKPDGMILDLNENAARRRNVCTDAMRGQNLFDFLPPEAASTRHEAIGQILKARALVQYDETRSEKHYRIRLYPVMDTQGKVIQVACFSRDITENKRAEEETRRLMAQLIHAQKMEALGTLAGGIAHDFNNILSAILGYAGMAQDASPLGSVIAKHLNKIVEGGERAATLVKQILAFSRQANIERIPLEPAHIVKEAVKLLRPSLPSTIAIRLQIETATAPILADPTQLHQILMNLCTNAFHAMEQDGGTLEIILKDCLLSGQELQHHPEVQPGRFVELSVSDSGQGITPEIRNKIFDPYFTTKEIGKGTGLGLAIVHGIVTSYGGFITCESEPEKGTVFHVFFPAFDQEVVPKVKPVVALPRGREHVLFVDDEANLAEMTRSMLASLGYEVTVRTSSLDALATFQKQPDRFDAVITDQTMPDMTGDALARRMLQIRPDLPIMLCTGYSSIISEEKAKSLGIKCFTLKPLTKKDFAVLLRKLLDK